MSLSKKISAKYRQLKICTVAKNNFLDCLSIITNIVLISLKFKAVKILGHLFLKNTVYVKYSYVTLAPIFLSLWYTGSNVVVWNVKL